MNCSLTNLDREKGYRCRSWDCKPCLEFNTSVNDQNIIRSNMLDMNQKEIQSLKQQLAVKDEEITKLIKQGVNA